MTKHPASPHYLLGATKLVYIHSAELVVRFDFNRLGKSSEVHAHEIEPGVDHAQFMRRHCLPLAVIKACAAKPKHTISLRKKCRRKLQDGSDGMKVIRCDGQNPVFIFGQLALADPCLFSKLALRESRASPRG